MSVTKSAEIENEKTETQSKQLEVDRITKLFKQNHEERRQLIQQWQKSIEVMKDRDAEIDKVSVKYREASEEVESQITDISKRRKEIFYIKVR
jgi:TolA-binding protein